MSRKDQSGFTLVELLVVIAIMAVLLSILVPALSQAKYQAMRLQCVTNVRAQHSALYMYGTDNEGKFPKHTDAGPGYVRSYGVFPKDQTMYGRLKDSQYLGDSQSLLCPVLAARLAWFTGNGVDTSSLEGFRSLELINVNSDAYANWNYQEDPLYNPGVDYGTKGPYDNSGSYGFVTLAYNWFANYVNYNGHRPEFDFEYDGQWVHTRPWAMNLRECREDGALITHMVGRTNAFFTDYSHNGAGFTYDELTFEKAAESADSPVGFGDGHVETVTRGEMQPRAREGVTMYYY